MTQRYIIRNDISVDTLFDFYKTTDVSALWPIREEKFKEIILGTNDLHAVTESLAAVDSAGNILGFVCFKYSTISDSKKSSITLIVVDPKKRKQKIGSRLLAEAESLLRDAKKEEIRLGAGAGSYFWPGIPQNLRSSQFFAKNGYSVEIAECVDMYQDIQKWEKPEGVYEVLEKNNIKIEFATKETALSILRFEEKNFPNWLKYYERDFEQEKYGNVFVAYCNREVVATSELWFKEFTWELLFEGIVGGGAALGVADEWQGKGIGSAMKVWGTEKVKEMGATHIWIGWTSSISFYKRLGFKVWRTYDGGKKNSC